MRRSLLAALGFGALALGCEVNAYCFDGCEPGVDGETGGRGGAGSVETGGGLSVGGDDGTGAGLQFGGDQQGGGGGGPVDCGDTSSDPSNCGQCGNVCQLTGAFPGCVDGECTVESCASGRIDLNERPGDGCEYECIPTEDPAEICDGLDNDCDGDRDEGFELDVDPENCGACGNVCELNNASAACGTIAGNVDCVIDECDDGFHDANGVASDGCEYECEVISQTDLCDAVDDDCDGEFGEDDAQVGDACNDPCPGGVCEGTCEPGTWVCTGTSIVCSGGVGPSFEVCDGQDNDCDGDPDEDFDFDDDPKNCGGCGIECEAPDAVTTCVAEECVIVTCKPGFADLAAGAGNEGCEYECPVFPTRSESCNGEDDDCNGVVDDATAMAAIRPVGYCRGVGGSVCAATEATCDGADGWVCNYPASVEVGADGFPVVIESWCDGLDNNCDGNVDEGQGAQLGAPCDNGELGACRDTGTRKCDPADKFASPICDFTGGVDPVPTAPDPEDCNGVDDDCDGDVDEKASLGPSDPWEPIADMVHIDYGGFDFYIDKYEAAHPDATDTVEGNLDTHVCTLRDVLPWTNVDYFAAEAACVASGRRLCTQPELVAACETAAAQPYPYGTVEDGDTCNGLEAGLGLILPTRTKTLCRDDTLRIYDLLGNAAEWTSTTLGTVVPDGGGAALDIQALHGGSYLTPDFALTCQYDLPRITTNAVTDSIGFRCCSDDAP